MTSHRTRCNCCWMQAMTGWQLSGWVLSLLLISVSRRGLGVLFAQSYLTSRRRHSCCDTNDHCLQFIMGLLIAGARATGTSGKNSVGLFIFLHFLAYAAQLKHQPSFADNLVPYTSQFQCPYPLYCICGCLHVSELSAII